MSSLLYKWERLRYLTLQNYIYREVVRFKSTSFPEYVNNNRKKSFSWENGEEGL
jgi:hypothetical protein